MLYTKKWEIIISSLHNNTQNGWSLVNGVVGFMMTDQKSNHVNTFSTLKFSPCHLWVRKYLAAAFNASLPSPIH